MGMVGRGGGFTIGLQQFSGNGFANLNTHCGLPIYVINEVTSMPEIATMLAC